MNPLIIQVNQFNFSDLSVFAMRFHNPILKNAMLITPQQIETIRKIQNFLWLSFVEFFLIIVIIKDVK
jgi:hypothetical protein